MHGLTLERIQVTKQWWVPFFITCRAQLWMSAVIPRCTIFSGGSSHSVPFLLVLLPSPLALRWMNYWLFSILHIHLTRNIYVYTYQIGVHITIGLSIYASNSAVLYSYGLQWHINDKCQIASVNAGHNYLDLQQTVQNSPPYVNVHA